MNPKFLPKPGNPKENRGDPNIPRPLICWAAAAAANGLEAAGLLLGAIATGTGTEPPLLLVVPEKTIKTVKKRGI